MNDFPISIQGLKKVYKLYDRPVDRLRELMFRKPYHHEFIALDDIILKVKKGETLGIIGENGAGKSTLLKIVAKTLKPSAGEISINGRISSLLELGSGFHPEFTGMDNIYFYGSLIGIPETEMKDRIQEIISFAEIGEYIHYPLKTYSSGMYVRLAFAVAMAVQPDILVVDEALSVGDLYFQKKSTDKILSFKEAGKTILFCSHSMFFINRLCDRVIWLQNGRIHMEGSAYDVTQAYETYQLRREEKKAIQNEEKTADQEKSISHVIIRNILLTPYPIVRCGDDLNIDIETEAGNSSVQYRVGAILKRVDGIDIIGVGTKEIEPLQGNRTVHLCFPSIQIKEGTFYMEVYLMDENFMHIYDTKASEPFTIPKETVELGLINLPHTWKV
jgi:ABC-type polysaccharide/polyol phosphate transport system ATPase subunit